MNNKLDVQLFSLTISINLYTFFFCLAIFSDTTQLLYHVRSATNTYETSITGRRGWTDYCLNNCILRHSIRFRTNIKVIYAYIDDVETKGGQGTHWDFEKCSQNLTTFYVSVNHHRHSTTSYRMWWYCFNKI